MKKIYFFIFIIIILINMPIYANDELVYIDKENIDPKYHRVTCSRITPNRYTTISVESAFAQGYRECVDCNPPMSDFERKEREKQFDEIFNKTRGLSNSAIINTNATSTSVNNTQPGVSTNTSSTTSSQETNNITQNKPVNPIVYIIISIIIVLIFYLIHNDNKNYNNIKINNHSFLEKIIATIMIFGFLVINVGGALLHIYTIYLFTVKQGFWGLIWSSAFPVISEGVYLFDTIATDGLFNFYSNLVFTYLIIALITLVIFIFSEKDK